MAPERAPVIVGVGEISERGLDVSASREPVDLMVEALRAAEADGGAPWLGRLQSVDIVNQMGWRYADIAGVLASRLTSTARVTEGPVGGESPLRLERDRA